MKMERASKRIFFLSKCCWEQRFHARTSSSNLKILSL